MADIDTPSELDPEAEQATPAAGTTLFGYRHVSGVPLCPCRDPGNYMMGEQGVKPLEIVFRCWCGSKGGATFDSLEERAEYLSRFNATPSAT